MQSFVELLAALARLIRLHQDATLRVNMVLNYVQGTLFGCGGLSHCNKCTGDVSILGVARQSMFPFILCVGRLSTQ